MEMQIKTTLSLHNTPVRMTIFKTTITDGGKDMEKKKPLYTAGSNVN